MSIQYWRHLLTSRRKEGVTCSRLKYAVSICIHMKHILLKNVLLKIFVIFNQNSQWLIGQWMSKFRYKQKWLTLTKPLIFTLCIGSTIMSSVGCVLIFRLRVQFLQHEMFGKKLLVSKYLIFLFREILFKRWHRHVSLTVCILLCLIQYSLRSDFLYLFSVRILLKTLSTLFSALRLPTLHLRHFFCSLTETNFPCSVFYVLSF